MPTSTRQQAKKQKEEAPPASEAAPGSKHKVEETDGHEAKRAKRAKADGHDDGINKKQTTIEESGGLASTAQKTPTPKSPNDEPEPKDEASGKPEEKTPEDPEPPTEARSPEAGTPSSILEKGVIYFFLRGRVNTDAHPSSVPSIARSFLLLRPLPSKNAALSTTSPPVNNARLLTVPKKVLPTTGRDRFLAIVEKSQASFSQLREEFLSSSEYETKTAGTSHVPPATPAGEGVYVITHTGSGRATSHLVYMLTLPRSGDGKGEVQLGEVQREMGIKERGSWVLSTKNPKIGGGAGGKADVEYPDEIQKEFGSLRWLPTKPEHFAPNAQMLLIGESDGGEKGLEMQGKDKMEGVQGPAEEMETLGEEDVSRLHKLSDDDAGKIFADLQADAMDYPKLQTEF